MASFGLIFKDILKSVPGEILGYILRKVNHTCTLQYSTCGVSIYCRYRLADLVHEKNLFLSIASLKAFYKTL